MLTERGRAIQTYKKLVEAKEKVKHLEGLLTKQLDNLGCRFDGVVCQADIDFEADIVHLETEDVYDAFDDGSKTQSVELLQYIMKVQ